MASRLLKDLHPNLQKAYQDAEEKFKKKYPDGPFVFITCTYRSPEEQHCLYIQPFDGKDNDGDGLIDEKDEKVTNADSMKSKHNFFPSKAVDFAFKDKSGKLNWNTLFFIEFARLMQKYDSTLIYGGDWKSIKDYPHVEML